MAISAIIVGASAAAAVGSASISASAQKSAAKNQAQAQEQSINAQTVEAEKARQERERSIAKEETLRQEAIAKKEEAIKNIKFPTYLESPEAQRLKGTLEERLAGRGFVAPVSPLDINAQTAPFAAQRRAGLKQTEAAISSASSARGLGRSTVPVAQIGEASLAAERDIEQRVAELQIQNKAIEESNTERERQQMADTLGRFENLTSREDISRQRKADFERGGQFDIADTITGKAGAIGGAERLSSEMFKDDQFAIANAVAAKGATDAAAIKEQANIWASAVAGLGKSAELSSVDIIDAIERRQKTEDAARVNIGGSRLTRSAAALNPEIFSRGG